MLHAIVEIMILVILFILLILKITGKITAVDEVYEPNLFTDVEVDYRMDDVSVENILKILRNRADPRVELILIKFKL
jgi:hypothetical protein